MAFKKSENPKTARIALKVTPAEKVAIEAAAKIRNLSVSEFILRRAQGKQAPMRYDFHAIDALERMALELKEHYRACAGRDEDYLQAFMDRLVSVSEAIWLGHRRS